MHLPFMVLFDNVSLYYVARVYTLQCVLGRQYQKGLCTLLHVYAHFCCVHTVAVYTLWHVYMQSLYHIARVYTPI